MFIKTIVNSAYQNRWCKIKAKVLEGTVYESLKEGKRKTTQFFFCSFFNMPFHCKNYMVIT